MLFSQRASCLRSFSLGWVGGRKSGLTLNCGNDEIIIEEMCKTNDMLPAPHYVAQHNGNKYNYTKYNDSKHNERHYYVKILNNITFSNHSRAKQNVTALLISAKQYWASLYSALQHTAKWCSSF